MSNNWVNWNFRTNIGSIFYKLNSMLWYKQSNFRTIQWNYSLKFICFNNLHRYLYTLEWNNNNECVRRLLNKLIPPTWKLLISYFYLTLSMPSIQPCEINKTCCRAHYGNQWRRIYNTINHFAAISLSNITRRALKTWIVAE